MNVDVEAETLIRRPRQDVATYAADPSSAPEWTATSRRSSAARAPKPPGDPVLCRVIRVPSPTEVHVEALLDAATAAFLDGLSVGCLVAAGLTAVGAVVAAVLLPARPAAPDEPAAVGSTGTGGFRRR